MKVENKSVIVTGAGSGIGAASAELFATHGAKVIVADINMDNADKVVQRIKDSGGEAVAVKVNVTKYEEVENMVNQTINHFGKLDVIVNNAGIGPKVMAKVADHSFEDWDRVIAVNQTGVFYCMKAVLPHMVKQGGGNIVNIASLAGLKASGKNLSYSASKFAVVGMTKSTALEYASKNVRVNAVCPGWTETAILDNLSKEMLDSSISSYVPMGRMGKPNEVAETILWLLSDKSSFVNGHCLAIDGGMKA